MRITNEAKLSLPYLILLLLSIIVIIYEYRRTVYYVKVVCYCLLMHHLLGHFWFSNVSILSVILQVNNVHILTSQVTFQTTLCFIYFQQTINPELYENVPVLATYTIYKITLTGGKAKYRVSGKIKPRTLYKSTVNLPKVKGSPHMWPDPVAPLRGSQSGYISLAVSSKEEAKTTDFEFKRWDGISGTLFGKSLCQVWSH